MEVIAVATALGALIGAVGYLVITWAQVLVYSSMVLLKAFGHGPLARRQG